jgi:hypothetical protein
MRNILYAAVVLLAASTGVAFAVDCDSEAQPYEKVDSPGPNVEVCDVQLSCTCTTTHWEHRCRASEVWHCISISNAIIISYHGEKCAWTAPPLPLFPFCTSLTCANPPVLGDGKGNLACGS